MMLVAANAVEAERLRVLELVEVLVVDVVALARIVERVRNVDPHRAVLGAEVVRQVRPRHQVEPGELHERLRVTGLGARNSAAARRRAARSAYCIRAAFARAARALVRESRTLRDGSAVSDVGGRGVVASPEGAVEIGQIAEPNVVRDRADALPREPRIAQEPIRVVQTLEQTNCVNVVPSVSKSLCTYRGLTPWRAATVETVSESSSRWATMSDLIALSRTARTPRSSATAAASLVAPTLRAIRSWRWAATRPATSGEASAEPSVSTPR